MTYKFWCFLISRNRIKQRRHFFVSPFVLLWVIDDRVVWCQCHDRALWCFIIMSDCWWLQVYGDRASFVYIVNVGIEDESLLVSIKIRVKFQVFCFFSSQFYDQANPFSKTTGITLFFWNVTCFGFRFCFCFSFGAVYCNGHDDRVDGGGMWWLWWLS